MCHCATICMFIKINWSLLSSGNFCGYPRDDAADDEKDIVNYSHLVIL